MVLMTIGRDTCVTPSLAQQVAISPAGGALGLPSMHRLPPHKLLHLSAQKAMDLDAVPLHN